MKEEEIRRRLSDPTNDAMRRLASREIHLAWIEFCVKIGHIPKISRTQIDPDFIIYAQNCKEKGLI